MCHFFVHGHKVVFLVSTPCLQFTGEQSKLGLCNNSSLYLLIPNPPPTFLFGNHKFVFYICAAAEAKSLQSCLTLCDPINGSPPGSLIPGILQARTLEWVAISFSNAWKWKVKVESFSCVRLLATPWAAAYQAPQSMGFSRQEYWSGVPLPSPVILF